MAHVKVSYARRRRLELRKELEAEAIDYGAWAIRQLDDSYVKRRAAEERIRRRGSAKLRAAGNIMIETFIHCLAQTQRFDAPSLRTCLTCKAPLPLDAQHFPSRPNTRPGTAFKRICLTCSDTSPRDWSCCGCVEPGMTHRQAIAHARAAQHHVIRGVLVEREPLDDAEENHVRACDMNPPPATDPGPDHGWNGFPAYRRAG